MRKSVVTVAAVCTVAAAGLLPVWNTALASAAIDGACAARPSQIDEVPIEWYGAPAEDAAAVEEWCRAVGAPVVAAAPAQRRARPSLHELVVVSWNAHLSEGRLPELVADLREGRVTGAPVEHFVLCRRGERLS